MSIVCKFGGSSMADAKNILKVASIIKSDEKRSFVVVSAPGKRDGNDTKITDMLIKCSDDAKNGSCAKSFESVSARFIEIVKELGIKLDIETILKETQVEMDAQHGDYDFCVSRGEYLNARIMAEVLGFEFVDACDIIKFDINGDFIADYTNDVASKRLQGTNGVVVPGFYGSCPNKRIKTFSRGGSDISGSIIARAVKAEKYENWTDVDGVLSADPRIVKDPKPIRYMSYKELRELAYMGASVLHADAIFPVRVSNIPIHLKSTFLPDGEGTMIVPDSEYEGSGKLITGIAGKKNYTIIFIAKSMMNQERGFARKVLSILERYGINFEHMPSGIDTLSLVIPTNEIENCLDEVVGKIKVAVDPDNINILSNISLIAVVGHGMTNSVGTAGKLFTSIAEIGANIRIIDQGSSEMNIIVGVDNKDFEVTINAIYNKFFN